MRIQQSAQEATAAVKAVLAGLIGIGCIVADTHMTVLAAHPFGILVSWVAATKVLTGWQGGAVATVVSLWVAALMAVRFPGLPLESAAFIVACITLVFNEYHKQTTIDRLRARVRELEQPRKDIPS